MTLRLPWTFVLFFVLCATTLGSFPTALRADQANATQQSETLAPEEIIRRFAAKETEFYRHFKNHSFKRDVTVQLIGMGKQIAGEYRRVSRLALDTAGNYTEHVIAAPISPLVPTQEDMKDFGTIQTLVIEASKIGEYDFTYIGKERIDELDVYVFDVKPKLLSDPRLTKLALKNKDRYFEGRIYIDTQDFQLVKARGRGVPEGKQRYPTFESYREQVDGRYWFPRYTYADDELVYPNGSVQRVRLRIRFSDYELQQNASQSLPASVK